MLVRQVASFARTAGGSAFIEPKYLEGKPAYLFYFGFLSDGYTPAAIYYAISTT